MLLINFNMKNFFITTPITHSIPRFTRNIILAVLGAVTFISVYIYCIMQISNSCSSLSISFGPIKSPLDQFEIRNLLSLDAPILANLHISLTNIGLYLTITASIALVLNLLATNYNKVIANS